MQKIVQCMLSPVLNKFDNMNVNESMNQMAESMINVYSEVSWQFYYSNLFFSFSMFYFTLYVMNQEVKKSYIVWIIIASVCRKIWNFGLFRISSHIFGHLFFDHFYEFIACFFIVLVLYIIFRMKTIEFLALIHVYNVF